MKLVYVKNTGMPGSIALISHVHDQYVRIEYYQSSQDTIGGYGNSVQVTMKKEVLTVKFSYLDNPHSTHAIRNIIPSPTPIAKK